MIGAISPRRHALSWLGAGLLSRVVTGVTLVIAGCATTPVAAPANATLIIVCEVSDASLWIDDRYLGPAATWARGAPIFAGFRRIEVRHPDYFSFYAEITAKAGETVRLSPILRRLLD